MKKLLKSLLTLFLFFLISNSFGQSVEMADTLRSEGKIYVVVSIILLVLTGLIVYLFGMDRKLNKLEKQLKETQKT